MEKYAINPSYETNSYVYVGEDIKLNLGIENTNIKWISNDETKATVNNGIVTGVTEGNATINAFIEEQLLFSFNVLVLENNKQEIINDLLKAHNSNIYHNDTMWIDGKNGYKADIYESVSKIIYNYDLNIDSQFLESGIEKWKKQCNEFLRSTEFITVHYTGNISPRANAFMHGKYFVNQDQPTSIHYNTGNDGIFLCLDNDKRAAHAGDSAGPEFEWLDTNVEYDGCDIDKVNVTASKDFYFVINGKKSIIPLPQPYVYKDRKTQHVYTKDGLIQLQDSDVYKKPEEMFNKLGFAFIVKDNKYFMSQTWWCYTQRYEGAICNVGGNRNSIGIESAVNEGSDLWYTWQITAKLVAKLMVDNKLDINRVKPHHFYSAKNCPQPMMENNMEIWFKFIELVKFEYLFMTKYKDYKVTISNYSENINDKGRVLNSNCNLVEYTINVYDKDNNLINSLILSSVVK